MKSRSILHGIILMLVNKAIGRTKRDGRVHGAESVTRIQKKILTVLTCYLIIKYTLFSASLGIKLGLIETPN